MNVRDDLSERDSSVEGRSPSTWRFAAASASRGGEGRGDAMRPHLLSAPHRRVAQHAELMPRVPQGRQERDPDIPSGRGPGAPRPEPEPGPGPEPGKWPEPEPEPEPRAAGRGPASRAREGVGTRGGVDAGSKSAASHGKRVRTVGPSGPNCPCKKKKKFNERSAENQKPRSGSNTQNQLTF